MRLKEYLRTHGIKLRAAARQLETTPGTLSKVSNGKNPSIDLARRIYMWSGKKVNLLEEIGGAGL